MIVQKIFNFLVYIQELIYTCLRFWLKL